ncbi:uncharacterized protein EDB91DRAFT_1159427 [Suillus paluster]|uniref:uncharacterized protein n=1 Tax=Suillus paluster TaxID=48578 RepID=UPI001B875DBF|nr:uncharacterized protein EDB91DRAFT_1159427 [Suillus paluster]KAG1729517.1 hypothetical protein EDB91DRAFT_1159427 [Suillus paluster]
MDQSLTSSWKIYHPCTAPYNVYRRFRLASLRGCPCWPVYIIPDSLREGYNTTPDNSQHPPSYDIAFAMNTAESEARQMLVHSYAILAANSILMYDHLATLPEEIAFIWYRPKALSAMLFLVNRYVALLGNVFGMFSNFLPASNKSCSKYVLTREVLLFFQQFIVCSILCLRTYALYDRSKRLLGWMIIIGLVLGGGAFAGSFINDSGSATNMVGDCHETYTVETAARHGVAWLALFVYELVMFILTVFRTCKTRESLRFSLLTSRRNILGVMFQDGTLYFG